MKEICINNSKLKLVDFSTYELFTKSGYKFRYKLGIIFYPDTVATFVPYKDNPEDIKPGYLNFYGLVFGDRKYTAETYDYEEKTVLSQIMGVMLHFGYIDTAEIICRALKNPTLATEFYGSYGYELDALKNALITKKADYGFTEKKLADPKTYHQNDYYSIYDLVNDLIRTGSWIYTDPELIGSYKKISRSRKDGSEFVPDKWSKIIGKHGNRTRANLNIAYEGTVTIDVPKNDLGVAPGPRELKAARSFCLVRDGRVWMKKIGVRVDQPWLVRRLYASKIVECKLIYNNEFLLDLSKLRIVKRSDLRNVDSFSMGMAEVNTKLAALTISYYTKKKYMLEKGLAKLEKIDVAPDPAETFLHSLGIYGDTFYPKAITTDKPEETYQALEVIGNVSGLPADSFSCIRTFINTGKSRNKIISAYLQNLPTASTVEECDELIKKYEKKQKHYLQRLRDLKFRLILGKTLTFWQHNKPRVIDTVQPIAIGPAENCVKVSWKVVKSTITV